MFRSTLAACTVLALAAAPASADTVTKTLSGNRLELRLDCAVRVEIQPQADLAGKVEITAESEGDASNALRLTAGDAAMIEYHPRCGLLEGNESLELTIHVPPAMPIDISEASAGDYEIGAVGGPLRMRLSGAAEIRAAKLASLDLDSAGASQITIDELDGPGVVGLHGGGDLSIEGGTMPKLKLETHGAGEIDVSAGEIGLLDISMAGAGNADIHAAVKDAKLEIIGIGRIAVDKVSGHVSRNIIGLGSIDIDG